MKERKVSIIFKLLVVISLLAGILLNMVHTTSISAILSYYTLQSNIVCLIMFLGIMIAIMSKNNYRTNSIYYLLKGGTIMAILITGITYQIALAPNNFYMDISYTMRTERYWANLLVHVISPILVLLDYVLFDEKGNFKYYYPIIWLFLPLSYVIYVYSYSARGGSFYGIGGSREFAYIFLDYNKIGYSGVFKSIIIIAILILLVSYLFVFLDRKLKRKWFDEKRVRRVSCLFFFLVEIKIYIKYLTNRK